jgi:integrase
MLETFVFKEIGSEAITKVTAPAVLKILRQLEAKHHNETARRTKQRIGQILRYAIATGRAERDVTADLRGALVPFKSRNHAALTEPGRVGELLRAIDGYAGQVTTQAGLQLAALLFLRPGELRAGQWSELELEGNEPTWRIPAHRMKMRDAHIVPLSKQAVAILNELKGHTGKGDLVFPAIGNKNRPISENTLNTGLRRLGYSNEEMTSHGFRTIASTLLNEKGLHPDLIELQLAHKERNGVRAAYNKAQTRIRTVGSPGRRDSSARRIFASSRFRKSMPSRRNLVSNCARSLAGNRGFPAMLSNRRWRFFFGSALSSIVRNKPKTACNPCA